MTKVYREYQGLDLRTVSKEVLKKWEEEKVFEKSVEIRAGATPYVFYEGPPSANGMPGIHHVMARAIKDIFCRYKTLKGFLVKRKAGWDTHGLPIELGVEKELGITKEDIGKKISVEDYNKACKKAVMKYTDKWNELTKEIGYWVDLDNPYITYETKYIETVWHLLNSLYKKGLLYKGYTVQPYSPAAGSGLSTHELNQPGCYRNVKDTSVTAQFKVIKNNKSESFFNEVHGDLFLLAWTTTPWTLPSNTALAVGKNIEYLKVKTFNQYTGEPVMVILAKDLFGKYFSDKNKGLDFSSYQLNDKQIPFEVMDSFLGSALVGVDYEQLLPYVQPPGDAFRVIAGDYVTTEDGTGIVHIAPTFGADDARVAKEFGISPMLVKDENGNDVPLVDLKGRFVSQVGDLAGEPVKIDYYTPEELKRERDSQGVKDLKDLKSVDVKIAIKLKEENRAFKVEKYEHSYPHCWRTDKPVLYYPLDSWFVKTTAKKKELIAHNKTINWKPKWTGERRFGEWLENLQDWNLSRSRYWGIPIPIWTSEDKSEQICIGSLAHLKDECEKAVKAGLMQTSPLKDFEPDNFAKENYNNVDIHRPYVDDIVLVSPSGKPMYREADLIDVWFDSGAMPYAQLHYPFENKDTFESNYPADFIAEGVDQTRGWFYTLHAIGVLCFDSVAYKNVVSNGLVLDKNGQKMSKRLGNAVDPFQTLKKFGPDALRWYMISNAQPWDDLRFDEEGIVEVQRKFFGTLYNTYQFYAVYANIDGFTCAEQEIPLDKRPKIDRWILSRLNSLITEVDQYYADYEPTKAARAIQKFTLDHLSNWYVRLCRRRFWKGDYSEDKISAYQTLYRCLEVIAQLSSPIAPFYADRLFQDLNNVTKKQNATSVHLSDYPVSNAALINKNLEEEMDIAMRYSSMVLSLRKKDKIKVRQPLQKILVPVLDKTFENQINAVKDLILSEVNVKEIQLLTDSSDILVKKIKPNFKSLGPKYGKMMKALATRINAFTKEDIATFEKQGEYALSLDNEHIRLNLEDVEITSEDIPGWQVASEGKHTVALDITVTKELRDEGIARELINKVQNLRKEKGFEVTDGIILSITGYKDLNDAINNNLDYICSETLTKKLDIVDKLNDDESLEVELVDDVKTLISIKKLN